MRTYHLTKYDLWAGAIIVTGTLLRLVAIALGWPASYNDEGTLGLMALHIAYHGAHPLLYYGQDYLASTEAYLGAALFQLFGPSTFVLRLSLLGLFAGFLLFLYLLVSLLYSKGLALFTLILLIVGSPDVVYRQLMANGGAPDYFFFTTLLLLLTSCLALSANRHQALFRARDAVTDQARRVGRLPWTRLAAYAAWGVVAGLDIWSYPLCLPFVLCAALLLGIFCRKEIRWSVLSLLLLCFLLSVSPFLIYKATVPVTPYANSLFGGGYREPSYPATNGLPSGVGTISPEPVSQRFGLQVLGTLAVAVPVATSGTMLCPLSPNDAWPLTSNPPTNVLVCTGVHGIWGAGYVVLGSIAAFAALRRLWFYWKRKRARNLAEEVQAEVANQREEAVKQAARLMILMGAGLTLFGFILYGQASAVTPWISARYLVGLLIALPAVLFPLWEQKKVFKLSPAWRSFLKTGTRYGLLTVMLVAGLLGSLSTFTTQMAQAHSIDQEQQQLIQALLHQGATRIYTTYDDCDRIAFLSNEHIICAVLDDGLQPGLDRYFPYRQMVAEASHPFYVFPRSSRQAALFVQKVGQEHLPYQQSFAGGYVIYDLEGAILRP